MEENFVTSHYNVPISHSPSLVNIFWVIRASSEINGLVVTVSIIQEEYNNVREGYGRISWCFLSYTSFKWNNGLVVTVSIIQEGYKGVRESYGRISWWFLSYKSFKWNKWISSNSEHNTRRI